MLTKELLECTDACSVIVCNNHVINIKENESDTSEGLPKEECRIIGTKSETLLSNHITELSKSSSMSLFQAIESMMKVENLIRRMSVARKWLHVDFLENVIIEKRIFHIHME